MLSEASPEVTIGGRSLIEVRSAKRRNMASPANAEPPRDVNKFPRPSEICRRVPFSTDNPTMRLRRSYASIRRNTAGDLRRRYIKINNRIAVRTTRPKASIKLPPHADTGQRLVILSLLQAYEQVL